jgi:hypothetical protein
MKVYQLLVSQPTMGQYIPESWVGFEKILTGLVDRGIIYAKVNEVKLFSSKGNSFLKKETSMN